MFCVSCRTRKTLSRCKRKAIKGLQYCGTHARAKTKRIWTILNGCDAKALKIQKVWRGFAIRNRLSKLGPGVMKRSLCHNDEELVTLEPINKLNPFLYFALFFLGTWVDFIKLIILLLLILQYLRMKILL
jgi:hypothetical protein